jgi:hypothetical protein
MRVENRAGLDGDEVARLEALAARWPTLQEVVRWGFAQPQPLVVSEVIVQDEFTHDVILPYRGGAHLVFDTT